MNIIIHFFFKWMVCIYNLFVVVPAVSRKRFGSADYNTINTIYLSFCTQSDDPNLFWGTAGIYIIIMGFKIGLEKKIIRPNFP